jgi:hypothetical protein
MKKIKYDPEIIQLFADSLYSQAKKIMLYYGLLGTLLGLVVGYIAGGIQSPGDENTTAIIGAVVVGLAGLSRAQAKAFTLKLQAQQTFR